MKLCTRKLTRRNIISTVLISMAAFLFIGAGVLSTEYYLSIKTQQDAVAKALNAPKTTVPTKTVTITPQAVQGTPVKITIPSVGISQPVEPGYYDASTGKWTLSYHAVYWASMTSPINSQTGNTFIYGHDVSKIFGNLLKAKTGAKAIVDTNNGYEFTYTLKSVAAVNPNDISSIQQTDAPQITVQTCSGSWYQYRSMFTFTLDGYKKIS